MTNYTPSRWVLRLNTIFNTDTNPALKIAEIPNLRPYGHRQATDHDEEQANAHLIATAPDLLMACEQVLVDLSNGGRIERSDKSVLMARVAIAKATGKESW